MKDNRLYTRTTIDPEFKRGQFFNASILYVNTSRYCLGFGCAIFFFKFDELVHVRTKNTLLFSACKHDLMASLIRKCN